MKTKTIEIRNIKTHPMKPEDMDDPTTLHVYVGRGFQFGYFNPECGNPFQIGKDGDRTEVCEKFESLYQGVFSTLLCPRWTQDKLKQAENELAKGLALLMDKIKEGDYDNIILYCWCWPKSCHAETIKQELERGLC